MNEDTAEGLGIARQALSHLVNGNAGISIDMAVRLSRAFGLNPETWLGMQMAYELWQARDRADRCRRASRTRLIMTLVGKRHHQLPAAFSARA